MVKVNGDEFRSENPDLCIALLRPQRCLSNMHLVQMNSICTKSVLIKNVNLLRELMWNRNSAVAFSVHFFSLEKPLRPSPMTGYTCVDVRTADSSVVPLLDWHNGRMRIFLGNNNFKFVLI